MSSVCNIYTVSKADKNLSFSKMPFALLPLPLCVCVCAAVCAIYKMIDPIDFSYLLLRLKLERHEAKKGFVSASASALSSLSFSQLKSRMEVVKLKERGSGEGWRRLLAALCNFWIISKTGYVCGGIVFISICVYRFMVKLFKV